MRSSSLTIGMTALFFGALVSWGTPVFAADSLPDLVPTIVSFNRSSRSPSASVSNQGDAALGSADTFVVTFHLFDSNGTRIGFSMTQPLPSAYKGLPPGRSAYFSVNGHNQLSEDQAARVASVKVLVDQTGKIAESVEDNNEKISVIDGAVATAGPGVQPDLVVTSATLDRTNGYTRVRVLNQGTLDFPHGKTYGARVEYLDDAGAVVTSASDHGPGSYGLAKGHSEQLDGFLRPGTAQINRTARLRVVVDGGNAQEELDEANNTFEADVPGEHGLPDLVVTGASFSRSSRFTSVSIKNIGALTVPSTVGFTIRAEYLDANGDVVTTAGASSAGVGPLSPTSGNRPVQRFPMQPSVAQAERITSVRATVDSGSAVEESNEDNNIWPVPIVVVPPVEPPPTVTPTTTGDVAPAPDETVVATVGILPTSRLYVFKNWGQVVRTFFTRDPKKKAELTMQYANQKILEAYELKKEGKSAAAEKHLERYNDDLQKVSAAMTTLIQKDPKAAELVVKKAIEEGFRQQAVLDSIVQSTSKNSSAGAAESREKAVRQLEKMIENISSDTDKKSGEKEELKAKLRSRVEQKKIPESIPKDEVSATPGVLPVDIEKQLQELDEVLKKPLPPLPKEIQERIKPELENAKKALEEAKMQLPAAKEILKNVQPAPDVSCEGERFGPVCGSDGVTYDNTCFAKQAGVVIADLNPCPSVEKLAVYPSVVEIVITPSNFTPMVVDLARGGLVNFVNHDLLEHTITRGNNLTVVVPAGGKATMSFGDNRGIYTISSEQNTAIVGTVVTH